MSSGNRNRPQPFSQLDPGGVLKNAHDFNGNSLRVRDSLSTVEDYFTHYRVTYDGVNPTLINYLLGTAPHISEIGVQSDVAGSLNNEYFFLTDAKSEQKYHVWYNVSGGGTDPAPANSISIEVPIVSNDEATIVAQATQDFINLQAPFIFFVQRIGGAVVRVTNKRFGEADNTINGTTTFIISNTSGTQKLVKEVNISYSGDNPIWEGQELDGYRYNIFTGKFELNSVDVNFDSVAAEEPFISNLTTGLAGSESSFVLPINTVRFLLKSRGSSKLQISFITGQTGTNFLTLKKGTFYSEEGLSLTSVKTIYLEAPNNNNVDVELVYWT